MSESDEEQEVARPRGRPNAWFAEHGIADEPEVPDGFSANFRGLPVPKNRGGAQAVKAEDVHGSAMACWCGKPLGHDWVGKKDGAPHPREGSMNHINRRSLRAYHSTLQTFILHAVNEAGLNFREKPNGVVLYPPDGSQPITVYARNTERQLRSLVKWWQEHGPDPIQQPVEKRAAPVPEPPATKAVTPDVVKALAEKVNGPEHPIPEVLPEPEPEPEPLVLDKPEHDYVEDEQDEWVPYRSTRDGHIVENIETNGTMFRCRACLGTEQEWISDKVNGISGHIRIRHRPTEDMWGEEAMRKKILTRRATKSAVVQVGKAIEMLMEAVDYQTDDSEQIAALEAKVAEQQQRIEELEAACADAATAVARAEEAEARLALIKESLQI
jgi:uncharacterized coiled-coil protein SlyX